MKSRRHHRTDASPAGSDYHNLAVNEIYQERYESDDSEYGNFNPNLFAHKRTISEAFEHSGIQNQNSRKMMLTDQSLSKSSWSQSLLNNSATKAQQSRVIQAANKSRQ